MAFEGMVTNRTSDASLDLYGRKNGANRLQYLKSNNDYAFHEPPLLGVAAPPKAGGGLSNAAATQTRPA